MVPRGDVGEQRIGEDLAVGHGVIGGQRHPGLAHRGHQHALVEIGVILDLIGDERCGAERQCLREQSDIVVAHADMERLAGFAHGVERADLVG